MEIERASSVYCMPWKFAQSVPDLQKLCVVDHLKTPASVSSLLCEAMEFLLTDEELKKVKKLLPKIAKKHGLQCSLLESSKGTPSCKSSKGQSTSEDTAIYESREKERRFFGQPL